MFASLPRVRSARFVIALVLTLAMVFAHWQGLAHRVAHAWQTPSAVVDTDQKAVQHSCLAYDAATVAPALDTPPCTAAAVPAVRVLALWSAFASWDAPFTPYFSSRAPPVA